MNRDDLKNVSDEDKKEIEYLKKLMSAMKAINEHEK